MKRQSADDEFTEIIEDTLQRMRKVHCPIEDFKAGLRELRAALLVELDAAGGSDDGD